MSTTEEIISIPRGALSEHSYEIDVVLIDGDPVYWLAEPAGMLADRSGSTTAPLFDWSRRKLMHGSPLMAAVQRYVLALRDDVSLPLAPGVL